MVQMPVRVKPPPADSGEIISPGCALRSTTTPANGARIRCLPSTSPERCASSRAAASWASRLAKLGPQHAGSRLRFGQIGLGGIILPRQRLGSIEDSLGVGQIGGNRGHGRIGGLGARLRQRVVLVRQDIVEPGENLAGLHHHALVDQKFDDLARDLGRDRGLPARHHIAGRDQTTRGGRGRWGWLLLLGDLGGCDLGCGCLRGRQRTAEPKRRAASQHEQDDQYPDGWE